MRIKSWKETRKQFEESLILDWFVQLTNAIWYIHERRILHRDIKTRFGKILISKLNQNVSFMYVLTVFSVSRLSKEYLFEE